MKFGSSFITIMFTSALLGFFLGTKVLGWSVSSSLALSGILSFLSIVLDVLLFMLKDHKQDKVLQSKKTA